MSGSGLDAGLFDQVVELPDPAGEQDFDTLVGMDEAKELLVRDARVRLSPDALQRWAARFHESELPAVDIVLRRPPLYVLAGDVGCGKTTLARGFGNRVAREADTGVTLYSLSLAARGSGAVGEMTRLLTAAFQAIRGHTEGPPERKRSKRRPTVLLIDEADALAQSRAEAQMHHEDRAGVNALIRGIDDLATRRLPVVVVMCTNRLNAIDPAVQRRAAAVLEFRRPNVEQAMALLERALSGARLPAATVRGLAETLTASRGTLPGCTHSDIVQRFVPSLVLDAFPSNPIRPERARTLASTFRATPPFQGTSA